MLHLFSFIRPRTDSLRHSACSFTLTLFGVSNRSSKPMLFDWLGVQCTVCIALVRTPRAHPHPQLSTRAIELWEILMKWRPCAPRILYQTRRKMKWTKNIRRENSVVRYIHFSCTCHSTRVYLSVCCIRLRRVRCRRRCRCHCTYCFCCRHRYCCCFYWCCWWWWWWWWVMCGW